MEKSRSESWPRRLTGVAVPAVLGGIAAIHVAWAAGWRWPGGSDERLAERVLSSAEGTELPPAWATVAVAAGLSGAAVAVFRVARGDASRVMRAGALATATVLLVRGAVYPPLDVIRGFDEPYERLDIAIYSPLCLALGAGALLVARGAADTTTGRAREARARTR